MHVAALPSGCKRRRTDVILKAFFCSRRVRELGFAQDLVEQN
jgi:hypothetical protein